MTPPAQMTDFPRISVAEPRTLRSASGLLAQAISDAGETSSSDDSSRAGSAGEGEPLSHSAFGAVLRQYVTASSSETSAKADTSDSNPLAAVPSSKNEGGRSESSSTAPKMIGAPSRTTAVIRRPAAVLSPSHLLASSNGIRSVRGAAIEAVQPKTDSLDSNAPAAVFRAVPRIPNSSTIETGQQEADSGDSNPLAAVPVQPKETTRGIYRAAPRTPDSPTIETSQQKANSVASNPQAAVPIPPSETTRNIYRAVPRIPDSPTIGTGRQKTNSVDSTEAAAGVFRAVPRIPSSRMAVNIRPSSSASIATVQQETAPFDSALPRATGTPASTVGGISDFQRGDDARLSPREAAPEIADPGAPPDSEYATQGQEPLKDSSNASPASSSSDMPIGTSADRPATDREPSSAPSFDRTSESPDWVKTAVLTPEFSNPELFKLELPKPQLSGSPSSNLGATQPVADERTSTASADLDQPEQSNSPREDTPAPASPGQAAGSTQTGQPETLAFAARISSPNVTPAVGDDSVSTATPAPSFHAQTLQKQVSTPDTEPAAAQIQGAKGEPDAPGLVKTNVTQLSAQPFSQNEPATSVKGETHPTAGSPPAHAEPATEHPAAQPTSSRDITVRIPDDTERGTNVRFVERGSEVHVSVRTGDSELAQMLRGGLGDLTAPPSAHRSSGGSVAVQVRTLPRAIRQNQFSDPKGFGRTPKPIRSAARRTRSTQ